MREDKVKRRAGLSGNLHIARNALRLPCGRLDVLEEAKAEHIVVVVLLGEVAWPRRTRLVSEGDVVDPRKIAHDLASKSPPSFSSTGRCLKIELYAKFPNLQASSASSSSPPLRRAAFHGRRSSRCSTGGAILCVLF